MHVHGKFQRTVLRWNAGTRKRTLISGPICLNSLGCTFNDDSQHCNDIKWHFIDVIQFLSRCEELNV